MNKLLTLAVFLLHPLSSPVLAEESAKIQVQVVVKNELPDGQFSKNWPVHIFLTAPGAKVPLSLTKTDLEKLPLTTTLTEKKYVLPTFTLEGHNELVLITKISSNGDPHKAGPEDYRKTSQIFTLDQDDTAQIEMILK